MIDVDVGGNRKFIDFDCRFGFGWTGTMWVSFFILIWSSFFIRLVALASFASFSRSVLFVSAAREGKQKRKEKQPDNGYGQEHFAW